MEAETLTQHPLPPVDRAQISLGEVLGQGASGVIHRAEWQQSDGTCQAMAAKLFKGSLTSDGLPHSEMAACIAAGAHPNLIPVAGPLAERANTLPGLLLALIDPAYQTLAAPPSLASCTRDCYAEDRLFSVDEALHIASDVAAVVAHLHSRGILHGDLYAHNLLVNQEGHTLLSDFGAASFFDPSSNQGMALKRIETRAFGCLLEELLQCCNQSDTDPRMLGMAKLMDQCLDEDPSARPDFAALTLQIDQMTGKLSDTAS